jgi:hypothetical protein
MISLPPVYVWVECLLYESYSIEKYYKFGACPRKQKTEPV